MGSVQPCHVCHSFKSAGLHQLSESNLIKLEGTKSPKHFKKGEVIYNQGELPDLVYCLRSGMVKLESYGDDGHVMAVGFVKGGDVLGLNAILSQAPSSVTATAIEETYACSFKAPLFKAILTETPSLAIHYMGQLLEDLRETRQRLLSTVDKDVKSRVSEALIYLKANYPDHKFTRKEIAEWAGTSTESVIRVLGQLEEDGIISQIGRHIQIADRNRLTFSARLVF